jgi:hypothetical protein
MLNIYRVISLSLVMSLFFAAPLLCVQPISFRLKKEQSLAAKLRQTKGVTVTWQKGSDRSYHRGPDALAQSLLRARKVKDNLPEDDAIIPSVFVEGQEKCGDHYEQSWNDAGETADFGSASTISNTSL